MADSLWIAGLLWDLLISITVSLIHSLTVCIPEVYCGRPSLDSRTAVGLAGSIAHIHAVSLIHSLMVCIPEVYCGKPSLDSRTAVGLAGSVARIHNGQSNPLPNGLYT